MKTPLGSPGFKVTTMDDNDASERNIIVQVRAETSTGHYLHPEAYGLSPEEGIASLHNYELPNNGKSIGR